MIEYLFYLDRFLHRRRHEARVVLVGVAILITAVLLSSFVHTEKAEATLPPAKEALLAAPQPGVPEQAAGVDADFSKDKPRVALPAPRPTLAESIQSIQSGINTMLEAGNRLLVSEKKVMVDRGDTLVELLMNKADVPRDEAYQAVRAMGKLYSPRDIIPGREITVFFHKDPLISDSKFSGLRIEKDSANLVTVNRDDKGGYTAKKVEKIVHRILSGAKGAIDTSLYVDARAAGVPDRVILDLIKMYSWNVDFQREIQPGDKFEVMYEQYRTEDGKLVHGKGNIIYAKMVLSGRDMPFYRYDDGRGDIDYYDDHGMSAKKPLMKTPVDGARLTSGFGMRRHPILGYSKKHAGVDFGAPRGTPIYAAGDGVITRMGPFSSYGNYMRIRHRNGLDTAYAHMSRYKSGLRSGQRVKQGEIIGYVGTTGRSTGPHLHYEVLVSNRQVNPATVKLPTGRVLKGKDLKSFQRVVAQARIKFNGVGHAAVAENRTASERTARN